MNISSLNHLGPYDTFRSYTATLHTPKESTKDQYLFANKDLEIRNPSAVDSIHLQQTGLAHFQAVLATFGLEHAQLNIDFNELATQETLPNNALSSLMAFEQIVQSLWLTPKGGGSDSLHELIMVDPEAFGLPENPSQEQIRNVVLQQLRDSSDLTFSLVHINNEGNESAGIFPPEHGENASQYWAWTVTGSEFPGPVWGLLERDKAQGAFHYGYF